MSKYLVAPLNWGLGHASRCVPLVQRLLDEGNEVVLAGDGDSLTLLRKHFPQLRYTYLAPLNLRYDKGQRQVWAMLKAFPRLLVWALKDHAMLKAVLREEPFDRIISDNRFGLYINHQSPITNHECETVYITHQLHVMLPCGWRWAESIASRIHARIYARFNKVWVPDFEDPQKNLSGELGHPSFSHLSPSSVQYIGPLSRFTKCENAKMGKCENAKMGKYDIVAVLSGLEPHRTMLEQELLARYRNTDERILIVQGLPSRPNTRIKRGNTTIVPYMGDAELVPALLGAKQIIARSGYSTVMDLEALGVMDKTELIPTPGQPEQEYLARYIAEKMQKE